MKKGSKVALVSCSNGISKSNRSKIGKLQEVFTSMGLEPVLGECVFEKDSVFGGSAKERAASLMKFYEDPEIEIIFDVSGGDIANEILPWLDFSVIGASEKEFWGYSDLTTILNGIYTKTGKASTLYQVRNLIKNDGINQMRHFQETVLEGQNSLYSFAYEFLMGEQMEGVVVGGNIRCLLKLAGTEYWPDMRGKILLLEAWSGGAPQMATYLAQLHQLGVFSLVSGILLGTFTMMEADEEWPDVETLVREYLPENMPLARTSQIGHGSDSRAIRIGEPLILTKGHK